MLKALLNKLISPPKWNCFPSFSQLQLFWKYLHVYHKQFMMSYLDLPYLKDWSFFILYCNICVYIHTHTYIELDFCK